MILVTGATGTVGRELTAQLLEAGERFRVLTRDPAKAAQLQGKAEIVQGDLTQPATLGPALAGVGHVFLLTADQDSASDRNLIAAAKAAGVEHVVKLSTSFVANDPQTAIGKWHADKEKLLIDSGLGWTVLRPGGFMSNSLQWAATVKAQGAVYSAAGDTPGAPIDPADIAAIAVQALTKPGHLGKAYELTGPELLTQKQQVEILARVLGRPIRCVDVTVEQAAEGMRRNPHLPPFLVQALVEMLEAIRSGKLARGVTPDVERLTGRKARTFEQWCRAHQGAFA